MPTHTYTRSHYKPAQRAEAKFSLIRKYLKSLPKFCVTALLKKQASPLFHIQKLNKKFIDCFYVKRLNLSIWRCVLFKLILYHPTEIHFKYCLEVRFLRLSTVSRLNFFVRDILHKIAYWYEAGCGTIFQLGSGEGIDLSQAPWPRRGRCHSLIAGRLWVAVAKCPSRESVGEGFLQQAKFFYWVRKRR